MSKTILQIAPTPFFSDRGCHIRIQGIVSCLTELGHSNTVCTYHHGRDVEGVKTKRIKAIVNYTQTAAGPSKYKLLADWRLLLLCVKEYRRLKPDVIHAHLHEGLLIGLLVKWLFFWRRTPVIGDMQGSLTGELEAHGSFDKKPYLRWPLKVIERMLMVGATHILSSSPHSLKLIRSNFNVRNSKISLVQDGANAINLLSDTQKQQAREKLQLPNDKVVIVYSGALLDSKGLKELKSLIDLCDPNLVHFLIIGYPTENLAPFIAEQQNNVTLTGQIEFEKLPTYLGTADIAIDPKANDSGEGSGKMLNYLASGLVAIAFDTANNRAFLPTGSKLANDVQEMVALINELAANKAQRQKIATDNLKHFSEHYSWSVTKQQLATSYARFG